MFLHLILTVSLEYNIPRKLSHNKKNCLWKFLCVNSTVKSLLFLSFTVVRLCQRFVNFSPCDAAGIRNLTFLDVKHQEPKLEGLGVRHFNEVS